MYVKGASPFEVAKYFKCVFAICKKEIGGCMSMPLSELTSSFEPLALSSLFCSFHKILDNIDILKVLGAPILLQNKTIGDGGITVDFWIIKVHTSN